MLSLPLGLKIKTIRTLREWHQADLAEQAGTNRQVIIAIEAGKVIPGDEQLAAIEEALSVRLKAKETDWAFSILAGQSMAVPEVAV